MNYLVIERWSSNRRYFDFRYVWRVRVYLCFYESIELMKLSWGCASSACLFPNTIDKCALLNNKVPPTHSLISLLQHTHTHTKYRSLMTVFIWAGCLVQCAAMYVHFASKCFHQNNKAHRVTSWQPGMLVTGAQSVAHSSRVVACWRF